MNETMKRLCRIVGHRWVASDRRINFRYCDRCGENGWVV